MIQCEIEVSKQKTQIDLTEGREKKKEQQQQRS
jgi:hypothetical protein